MEADSKLPPDCQPLLKKCMLNVQAALKDATSLIDKWSGKPVHTSCMDRLFATGALFLTAGSDQAAFDEVRDHNYIHSMLLLLLFTVAIAWHAMWESDAHDRFWTCMSRHHSLLTCDRQRCSGTSPAHLPCTSGMIAQC
jgi:hypothetical protein